ncbi:MAG: hypothetical protein AB7F40_07950 [Victivallaceae bacterium]|nr:hypothetical protein [Victivallaceae bacterium]
MRAILVVIQHPFVKVFLQHLNGVIDFLSKCYLTAVFNGTAPETLTMAKLAGGIPDDWREQREAFGMA